MPTSQDWEKAYADIARLEMLMREIHRHDQQLMNDSVDLVNENKVELLSKIAFARSAANRTWQHAQQIIDNAWERAVT